MKFFVIGVIVGLVAFVLARPRTHRLVNSHNSGYSPFFNYHISVMQSQTERKGVRQGLLEEEGSSRRLVGQRIEIIEDHDGVMHLEDIEPLEHRNRESMERNNDYETPSRRLFPLGVRHDISYEDSDENYSYKQGSRRLIEGRRYKVLRD